MQSVFALVGLTSSQGLALLVCVAVFATVMSVALPMLSGNELKSRMKAVALEREEVRARERARMSIEKERGRKGSVRQAENKGLAAAVVEKFNLKNALADEKTVGKLRIAGYRGQRPLTLFLFTRATLHLPGGDLVIEAPDAWDPWPFVTGLTLDGADIPRDRIRHGQLTGGATLHFDVAPEPG